MSDGLCVRKGKLTSCVTLGYVCRASNCCTSKRLFSFGNAGFCCSNGSFSLAGPTTNADPRTLFTNSKNFRWFAGNCTNAGRSTLTGIRNCCGA